MEKQETFQAVESLQLENSYAVLKSEENVTLEVTVGIKDPEYGWFEVYDLKSGGNDWYAEGSLQIEDNMITGYDGVFELPTPVIDKLREWGYDVSEVE